MIASIFSKSKPANLIITVAFVVFYTILVFWIDQEFREASIWSLVLNGAMLLFMLLLFDFINSKNNITQKNSYAVMFFGLLVILFPRVLLFSSELAANIFVLLAIRRLFSLKSNRFIKKKLFDAGFWIAIAILFNPLCIFIFPVVMAATLFYFNNDVKTLLLPFMGILCVLVIKVSFNILWYDVYITTDELQLPIAFKVTQFSNSEMLLKLIPIGVLLLWSVLKVFGSMTERNTQDKPLYKLVFWYVIAAITIAVLTDTQSGNGFIYLIPPVAYLLALNIETIEREWLKSSVIYSLLVAAVLSLIIA